MFRSVGQPSPWHAFLALLLTSVAVVAIVFHSGLWYLFERPVFVIALKVCIDKWVSVFKISFSVGKYWNDVCLKPVTFVFSSSSGKSAVK